MNKNLKEKMYILTFLPGSVFFSQHGPEAMMAIALMRHPSVSVASTIVEVFETILATALKSYRYI